MPSAATPEDFRPAAFASSEPAAAPAGMRVIADGDPEYPPGLRDLADPPPRVFARGRLPELARAVAIVGSRAATPYGRAHARELARDLARLGITIVSGLAQGIDAAAHEGALEAGGASLAVLPGALDAITPRAHRALAEALCARGGLLSERESGPPAYASAFLQRNRLIAALASVVVVVEAAERSGALSTAAAARRLGRPLLALPGDVDRPTARGVHGLLRTGARVCERAADVLAALPPVAGRAAATAGGPFVASAAAEDPGRRLAAAIEGLPRSAEDLARAAGLPLEETLARLLSLEWAGVVRREPGARWRRAGP